jgi:TonB family protein
MTKALRATIIARRACVTASAAPCAAQDANLAAARELYVAAEYSSALTMLTALAGGAPSKTDLQAIDLYRALCLLALGNTADANAVIESMLTSDPLYRPDTSDLPPRMRSALADTRKRLLPAIVQQRYVMAKAAFEAKQYAAAVSGFQIVLTGLADPDISPSTSQPPLSDLKVLASGFHELAAKAVVPVEAPVEAAVLLPVPPAPVAPAVPRIYSAEDVNVVPPQTIRQVVPAFPGRILLSGAATLDLIINETGSVDSASIVTSLNPQYDRMALSAARSWEYKPATLNGRPVKFRKRLQLTVVPEGNR